MIISISSLLGKVIIFIIGATRETGHHRSFGQSKSRNCQIAERQLTSVKDRAETITSTTMPRDVKSHSETSSKQHLYSHLRLNVGKQKTVHFTVI